MATIKSKMITFLSLIKVKTNLASFKIKIYYSLWSDTQREKYFLVGVCVCVHMLCVCLFSVLPYI